MSFGVQLGLLLALATAFASIVGFLYKHRGAVESPPVERAAAGAHVARAVPLALVHARDPGRDGSWGFHVAALALAPISLVQSVIAGGLVLLTVVADRLFGFTVTRREWIGVALTAAGLAFLAATLDGGGDEAHSDYDDGHAGALRGRAPRPRASAAAVAGRHGHRQGIPLALSAGLMWGASDVSIKALSDHLSTTASVRPAAPARADHRARCR